MKKLKKFQKFALSTEQANDVRGGQKHCPASLIPLGACDAYWGGDTQGADACNDYMDANCR